MPDPQRLWNAYRIARRDLLAERDGLDHWIGELSTSALSTATAISALAMVHRHSAGPQELMVRVQCLIEGGLKWLAKAQNSDGGWGDTDRSISNIATTMLASAAFHLAGTAEEYADLRSRAERFIKSQGGVPGLRRRYGKDKTFAVPILTNCALAGLVPWREVAPLPFELASLPNRLLGILRLPVVSYAIPALVAIGQARHFHHKPWNPVVRLVRGITAASSLKTLQRMQPVSGGFLEATPLTSFVVMSLASIGHADHPVTRRGVEFLLASVRADGSWPIDTNLATWGTTLSVNALALAGEEVEKLGCLGWLLSCQHREVHPFTSAAPGGWGWTDLSGAVPDADDSAGALLALAALRRCHPEADHARIDSSALLGLRWLLGMQNRDGGWPTFCRGWGTLPFDRSGVDLTAHAIRALHAWHGVDSIQVELGRLGLKPGKAIDRGLHYLARQQRNEGCWAPLWFGNQYDPADENPVYGTARVLAAYRDLNLLGHEAAQRAITWLGAQSDAEGGWGAGPADSEGPVRGVSSVEETAVAVDAFLTGCPPETCQPIVEKGLNWLIEAVESGRYRQASPIGFYFARLWYYERLYPLCFTVAALGQAVRRWPPTAEATRRMAPNRIRDEAG